MIDKTINFYNSNYCIKCLSIHFKQIYYSEDESKTETGIFLPFNEGFINTCANCSFEWLSPINKKAYYTFDAAEQLEAIKMFLDRNNIPSHDEDNKPYSYIGRIIRYANKREKENL